MRCKPGMGCDGEWALLVRAGVTFKWRPRRRQELSALTLGSGGPSKLI